MAKHRALAAFIGVACAIAAACGVTATPAASTPPPTVGGAGADAPAAPGGTPAPTTSPMPGASPPAASPSRPPSAATSATAFRLFSDAFPDGGAMPVRFTCDSADISPPLAWIDPPAGTGLFVLLVDDPDAGDFVHWLVGPIPASVNRLPEGAPADPPPQGDNGFGKPGWGGPCPPSGTHHYVFRLAAVPAGVAVPTLLTAEAVRALITRALAVAELHATYSRP